MYWQTSQNDKCRVGPFEKRSFDVKNSFDRGPIFCAEDFSHLTAMQNVNKYLSHGSHYLRYQNATQQKIILDDGKPTTPMSVGQWEKTVFDTATRFCSLSFFLGVFVGFFKKMGQPWPLLSLIFSLFKHQYNFCNKYMWKMSIQYAVPGFKHTTFGTWVSSHNH